MEIIYSKDYLAKSGILNYPFTGYYYQFITEMPDNDKIFDYESWLKAYKEKSNNYSNVYQCNTLIKKFNEELRCKISFLVDSKIREGIGYIAICILAVDNTIYKDISELIMTENKDKWFSQVAAIIFLDDESGFKTTHTNIFDMQYVPKCSFSIAGYLNNSNANHYQHYQSEVYDKSNFYNANNGQFIEINSGNTKLKDLMATQFPDELNGHMTIRSSGSIQL